MSGVTTRAFGCFNPAAAATDPNFASTVLLLSGDGTNGSTTFTDLSHAARGNATAVNDAQVVTAIKKFGTGSIRFDGTLDRLSFPDSADWAFGSGDFTIEAWALFDTAFIEANQCLISQWATGGGNRSWTLQYQGGLATNALQFAGSSAGTGSDVSLSFNWTPTADVFYHIAVDRNANTWRLYIDGTMVAKATSSITLFNSTTILRIGDIDSGSVETSYMKGNLDEVRITKGVARYASDSGYTVPTAAFPRS